MVKQVGLGTDPELIFHQLVARVHWTFHPISINPNHLISSDPAGGTFTSWHESMGLILSFVQPGLGTSAI